MAQRTRRSEELVIKGEEKHGLKGNGNIPRNVAVHMGLPANYLREKKENSSKYTEKVQ